MKLRGSKNIPEPQRILMIQMRRIGDVLLCTPALRALNARFPAATIDFVVEQPADECLHGNPRLDRLLVAPRSKRWSDWRAFVRRIREEHYDWTIDFFTNPRSAQFAFMSGARVRVGLNRLGRRWAYTHHIVEEAEDLNVYAADLRLNVLQAMGVAAAGRNLEIYADNANPAEAERAAAIAAAAHGLPLIAVATGSANPAKRYPADLSAAVITELQQDGFAVVLTSGPGEKHLAEDILAVTKMPPTLLADARVPTLAALYRRCALYVGPDSGPKHVAVACGVPTVTVFGPGRPSNWNDPQNPRNVLLTAPCDVRPHCVEAECAKRQCLRQIEPAAVVRAARQVLNEKPARSD